MVHRKQPQVDVNVDQMLHSLKSFGFFQISQFLLISSMVIAIDSTVYVIVFAGERTDFKCKNLTDVQLENFTANTSIDHATYETCNIKVYSKADNASLTDSLNCINGYEYTPSVERSIISQWDLVCSQNGLAELSQTCFIIGQSAGAFIFPILTEKFGRRPMHITCGFFLMVSAIICTLSSEYWIFVLGRILSGLFEEGYLISGVTAICELFSTDKRSFMAGVYSLLWSSAMSVPAFVAYLIRNYSWRIYCFYVAMTPIFFIIEVFFLEESIRWLFVTGKFLKAKKVIEKACRQNKADFHTVWAVAEKELAKSVDIYADENAIYTITVDLPDGKTPSTVNNLPEVKENTPRPSLQSANDKEETAKIFKIITIFKHPFTRYITLVNIFNWLVINSSYNSIYMLSEDLSGNMYLNFFLLAVMESTAAALYCIGIRRFGHKIPMISCELLGAVSLIAACLIVKFGGSSSLNKTVFRILHLCAMFGIGACFGGAYIYTPELYPTDVRSVGLGIASSFSRCGTMLAPFSRVLVEYAEWAPSALFGLGLLISALLVTFFMPETSKIQLPQTMNELIESKKQKKLKNKLNQVYEQNVEE